jgi:hypothetical protein
VSYLGRSIIRDEVNFEKKCWRRVSQQAKEFVTLLLQKDASKRPTAAKVSLSVVDTCLLECTITCCHRRSAANVRRVRLVGLCRPEAGMCLPASQALHHPWLRPEAMDQSGQGRPINRSVVQRLQVLPLLTSAESTPQ